MLLMMVSPVVLRHVDVHIAGLSPPPFDTKYLKHAHTQEFFGIVAIPGLRAELTDAVLNIVSETSVAGKLDAVGALFDQARGLACGRCAGCLRGRGRQKGGGGSWVWSCLWRNQQQRSVVL